MFDFKFKGKGLRPMNLKWWPPTQKEWAPILMNEHKVDWRKQSDPTTGRPWASLTPQYAIEKAKTWPGQPILRASGAMQDGAKIVPSGDGFNAIVRPYGVYHQFGTKKMVARPWLGLPDTALKKLPPIAWKHILSLNK
jgi:phage gpG-like protein